MTASGGASVPEGTWTVNPVPQIARRSRKLASLITICFLGGVLLLFALLVGLSGGLRALGFLVIVVGIAGGTSLLALAQTERRQLSRAPDSVRVDRDRVIARYHAGSDGGSTVVEKYLPFQSGTLFVPKGTGTTFPTITNTLMIYGNTEDKTDAEGKLLAHSILVAPEVWHQAQTAWRVWKLEEDTKLPQVSSPGPRATRVVSAPTPSTTIDGVAWYDNPLPRTIKARGTIPKRVGLDPEGVHIPGLLGRMALIPWDAVAGPDRAIYRFVGSGKGTDIPYWNISDSSKSLLFETFYFLGDGPAVAIATHPKCLRKQIPKEDLEELGLPVLPEKDPPPA